MAEGSCTFSSLPVEMPASDHSERHFLANNVLQNYHLKICIKFSAKLE